MRNLIFSLSILLAFSCQKKSLNIVTIGDSNGVHEDGWVVQLQKIRSNDSVFNCSISGNTIGFDNLGRDTLNTLKNIDAYLDLALVKLKSIDKIIIVLGTNDCKAVFDTLKSEIIPNLENLIAKVQNYQYGSVNPEILLCTPPPAGDDSVLIEKYKGIYDRLLYLLPGYQDIAEGYNCTFVDLFTPLSPGFDTMNVDGIHLNETGYIEMAKLINQHIK